MVGVRSFNSDHKLRHFVLYNLAPKTTSTDVTVPEIGTESGGYDMTTLPWVNAVYMETIKEGIQNGSPLQLGSLVAMTIQFRSKEPRDKIYALLGIAEDNKKLPFMPNYKDPEDVIFIKATAYLLSRDTWFTLFLHAGRGCEALVPSNKQPLGYILPSWVPVYFPIRLAGLRIPLAENLQSRDTDGRVLFSLDNPRTIQIHAVGFDSIQYLGPVLRNRRDHLVMPNQKAPGDILTEHIRRFLERSKQPILHWYKTSRQLAREYTSIGSQDTIDQDF